MKNKKIIIGITAFLYSAVLFLAGVGVGSGNYSPTQLINSSNEQLNKFIGVHDFLETHWLNFDSSEEMVTRALRGMLDTEADPYAAFFTKEEFAEYTSSLDGAYVGIGIQFQILNDYPIVLKTFEDSPAREADIRSGDLLVAVEGEDIAGLSSTEIGNLVKGKEGTKVNVTILRGQERIEKTLTRKSINSSVISYVKDGVGVIEISQFAENTAAQVEEALLAFQKQGIESFILDMRGNPGGYLDSVVATADLFLPKDQVVLQSIDAQGKKVIYRTKSDTILTTYTKDGKEFKMDFAILVDSGTASAAEVLTAALNEHLKVEILGSKTFGKGIIQTHFPLKDGSVIKYTSAEWLTPNGKHIHKQGVSPTIEVANEYLRDLKIFEAYNDFSEGDEHEQIVSIKLMLNYLGYKTDNLDARFDASTVAAVKAFQADQNLTVSGRIDNVFARRLVQHTLFESSTRETELILNKAIEALK